MKKMTIVVLDIVIGLLLLPADFHPWLAHLAVA
jgi:hypothetical protein